MNLRYLSLNIFRGITIAGMILVNNSGNSDYTYALLRHAEWHGFTPYRFGVSLFHVYCGCGDAIFAKTFQLSIHARFTE
ncbi:MAG: hypothetical protein U5N85_00585 [Arcicella sp.]|nr:hypothetical protein [Arcicella sp.]